MNFTVRESEGLFIVITEADRVVDQFQSEQDAQHLAKWLNQEYERVLSIL